MRQKMVFDDVAEYEKFNKMYNSYIEKGYSSEKALAATKEAFWPTKELSPEGKKAYADYIFNYGLTPEDAYILASRRKATEKKVEKEEPKKNEAPAVKSWFEDWINPVTGMKDWMDTLRPFNRFFDDDSFFKGFGIPCWLDYRSKDKANEEKKCKCTCSEKKEDKASAPAPKGADIVNDEIRKVLNSLPKEEVNDKNTKVNIVKNDPNDYEFNVDHTSADGKSYFHCSKKVTKSC